MKYVIMQVGDQRKAYLFPESDTHIEVATVISVMLQRDGQPKPRAISAGFSDGTNALGESESLGLKANEMVDTLRIRYGSSVEFMDDSALLRMIGVL